jgi:hypothetical protein
MRRGEQRTSEDRSRRQYKAGRPSDDCDSHAATNRQQGDLAHSDGTVPEPQGCCENIVRMATIILITRHVSHTGTIRSSPTGLSRQCRMSRQMAWRLANQPTAFNHGGGCDDLR